MADRRIGIQLDVKNDGIDRVRRSFDDVSGASKDMASQIKQMDSVVTDLVRHGWASSKTTGELREQLRIMQSMTNLLERQARVASNEGARRQAVEMQKQLNTMMGDVNAVSRVSNNPQPSPSGGGNYAKTAGVAAMMWGANQYTSRFQAGYSAAQNMNPALANFLKTLVPMGMQTEGGAYNYLDSLNAGLGFSYQDILNGGTILKGAMGRNSGFADQMRGVQQFGRMNGFDMNQAATYFGNAYQQGVTGGSQAQMSWQQYAILVANTVQAANMQGREGQVVSALQQMTQTIQTNTLNAPNQKTLGMLYATAGSTGNQALINQFPNLFSQVNAGIMNPGMGMMGQAAMWQAIAPGMNYWNAQLLQSQGATGVGPNGKTNFQNALMYAYKNFGGNSAQAAVMAGNFLNISPQQAQTLMQTYIHNGKFKEVGVDDIQNTLSNMNKLQGSNSMSDLDKVNKGFNDAATAMQKAGSEMLQAASKMQSFFFGNSTMDTIGGLAGTGLKVAGGAWFAKSIMDLLLGRTGATAATAAATAGTETAGATAAATAGTSGLLASLATGGSLALGVASLFGADAWIKHQSQVNAPQGYTMKPDANGRMQWYDQNGNPVQMHDAGGPGGGGFTSRSLPHYASGGYVNKPTLAVVGESGPERIVPDDGTGGNGRFNAQESARHVVATMLALRPYSSMISSAFGGSNSNSSFNNSIAAATATPFDLGFMNQLSSAQAFGSSLGIRNPMLNGSFGSAGPGGSQGMNGSNAAIISQTAKKYGMPDWIPLDIAMWESHLNNNANPIDSNGVHSTGLFQLNQKGVGYGYDPSTLMNPQLNSDLAIKHMMTAYKRGVSQGLTGLDLLEYVANSSGWPGNGGPSVIKRIEPGYDKGLSGVYSQYGQTGYTGSHVTVQTKPLTLTLKVDQSGNISAPSNVIHLTQRATINGQHGSGHNLYSAR